MINVPYIRKNQSLLLSLLSVALIYSMIFWTLLNTILIIALFTLWLFFIPKQFDRSSPASKLLFVFSSLYLVQVFGIIYSEDKANALSELLLKLPLLIFPLVLGTVSPFEEQDFIRIKKHFILAAAAACLISLSYGALQYITTGDPHQLTYQNLSIYKHSHPYFLGMLCLFSIAILFEKESSATMPHKTMRLLLAGLFSTFLFLLTLRLFILLLLLLTVFLIFRRIGSTRKIVLYTSTILITAALAILLIPSLQSKFTEAIVPDAAHSIPLDTDGSLGKSWGGKAIRLAIWECSLDVIREHPVWGVGTGDAQEALQLAYEKRMFYFASRYNRYNTHNQYLQLLVGNGIPALLAFLAALLFPLKIFMKRNDTGTYTLFILLISAICITEAILDANKGIVLYSFFNSLFAFNLLKSNP